jgi:hypothetical protein
VQGVTTVDDQRLLDLLSEMLAVERDGRRIYEQLLSDTPAELHAKLIEYSEQSRRSVLVLEETVRRLGGDPAYVSPGAKVVHHMTDAVMSASEDATERKWIYRALHLITYETRDRMIWEALDALGRKIGGQTGDLLDIAAGAVLSEEALGAHGADRNEERVAWALEAMESHLAHDLGVEAKTGRRRGLRRRR